VQRARLKFEAQVRGKLFIRRAQMNFFFGCQYYRYYNDIVACLVEGTAGIYPSKTGSDHIYTIIKSENEGEDCIGVTKRRVGNDR